VTEAARPRHVAIIADGNRRWARERGLPVLAGHVQGIEAIRPIVRRARDLGIETLSVYTFSTENWARPGDEVSGLFGLIDGAVRQYTDELVAAEERTAGGERLTLNICFNYSGRAEIVDAARALIAAGVDPNQIDEVHFAEHLYTAGQPDVDLLIRTGGDQRTSNFLIWQAAYAELVFSSKWWPDFCVEDLDAAVDEYARRERRFGG
jgi:undecaprenyl diphosphate synthase